MQSQRNKHLWLLKQAWLNRADEAFQLFVHGAVADWLEEQGSPEEAQVLRTGRWIMWYLVPQNEYRIYVIGEHPEPMRSYAVMWWPLAVGGANSERYTDSLGRPAGPMPDRTGVQGV